MSHHYVTVELHKVTLQFDLHIGDTMAEPGLDPLEESLLDPPSDALENETAPANVKLELKALSLLSAPVIVQLGALYAIIVVNQYFIGHLGAAPLAAAAIGNTVRAHVNGSAYAVLSPSEDWQLKVACAAAGRSCCNVPYGVLRSCSGSTSAGTFFSAFRRHSIPWDHKHMAKGILTLLLRAAYQLSQCCHSCAFRLSLHY